MRWLALLLVLIATTASAREFRAGDLLIETPWARATIGNLRMTAGYFVVENQGGETERLLTAESPLAERIELHTVKDGVMMEVEAIEIGPGDSLVFAPGGYHLMIGPLTGPLVEGEPMPATLLFERAGAVSIEFSVEAANATEPGPATN